MLLISWNVAGLGPLSDRIHESYNPVTNEKEKRRRPSAAMHEFMKLHGGEIFCLQEAKIPRKDLACHAEPHKVSDVEGFESFWSCCVDANSRGFNGVVTYAKKGMVQSADAAPLQDETLDNQGRCVMTDHGSFVLFNVYVPAGGSTSLSHKMKFLGALRRATQRQREKGRAVVLAGDLNIKHLALDRPWHQRVVHVDHILAQVESSTNGVDLPRWKQQLAEAWPKIAAALETKRVVPTKTQNSRTGESFDKFRLQVTVNDTEVYLGKHEATEGHCLHYYEFGACGYVDLESETEEIRLCQEANVVSVSILAELMKKIGSVDWDEATQRLIADTGAGVRHVEPTRQWLDSIIEEDGMVDTFRHFYPTAQGRFTCWSQYKNGRYSNEGVRLDYILVDKSLLDHVQKGDVPSLRCGCQPSRHDDPLGEQAALCAATANAAFQSAGFEGGGIGEASQTVLDTQFGAPHTGIIYTPPAFSDHVGISLLLNEAACQRELALDEKDVATRKAQPHKAQKSMLSFLQPQSQVKNKSKTTGTAGTRLGKTAKKPAPKTMKDFFGGGASKRPKLGPSKN